YNAKAVQAGIAARLAFVSAVFRRKSQQRLVSTAGGKRGGAELRQFELSIRCVPGVYLIDEARRSRLERIALDGLDQRIRISAAEVASSASTRWKTRRRSVQVRVQITVRNV